MLLHAAVNKAVTPAESLEEEEVGRLVEEGDEMEGEQLIPIEQKEAKVVLGKKYATKN
jgi:hypothetical protein